MLMDALSPVGYYVFYPHSKNEDKIDLGLHMGPDHLYSLAQQYSGGLVWRPYEVRKGVISGASWQFQIQD